MLHVLHVECVLRQMYAAFALCLCIGAAKGVLLLGPTWLGSTLTPSFPFLHPLSCLVCLLQIEKKSYYHVFKLAGFVGFDGDFKG
jgi:hypothetical protein